MQEPQIPVPRTLVHTTHRGLGWELADWPGGPVIGHGGGTIGQRSDLRLVPGRQLAVAGLCNGGRGYEFLRDLFRELLAELAGVAMPEELAAPGEPGPVPDPDRYTGRYGTHEAVIDITSTGDGRLWATESDVPNPEHPDQEEDPERYELVCVDTHRDQARFIIRDPTGTPVEACAFLGADPEGRAEFLHSRLQAVPRMG